MKRNGKLYESNNNNNNINNNNNNNTDISIILPDAHILT